MFLMRAGVKAGEAADCSGRLKCMICLLLLLATVINYFDRQVLSLTATKLIAEFHLSEEGFGQVVSAFRYAYAFVQLFGGWIVDAYGVRIVFPAAVGLWSMAGILTAFAPTLPAIVGCRFLLGVGEAFNWPCALKTTQRLLNAADRPLANGIFNSGTALGAMLAPVVVTISVLRWGWHSPFIFTGGVGAVWIFLWLRFTKTRSYDLAGRRMPFAQVCATFTAIGRKKSFWLLVTSAVIVNSVSYFLADWIPLYLQRERGFTFGMGNMLSILVYAGLDAGNVVTGVFARAATRRGISIQRARTLSVMVNCMLMTFAIPVGFTHSRYLALGCIILTAAGVAGFLVVYLTLVQEVEPTHVGAAAGMLGGLGNLFYGLASPFIGRLADLGQTRLTFLLLGMLPWLAFFTIYPATRMKPIAR